VADELYDGNKSELARACGMKPNNFSKYVSENGRRPGAKVLIRLSHAGI